MGKKRIAVIVAGGKGLRMGRELPKQFLCLNGKPILMHTLERFADVDSLILVLPKEHFSYWQSLVEQYDFKLKHKVVGGGATRFHSVQNALKSLAEDQNALIAIHDGVRPIISQALIEKLYQEAEESGAVLPSLAMVESLRLVEGASSRAVARDAYRSIQTPQVFDFERLRKAYDTDFQDFFTDDASVYEHCFQEDIKLIEGERQNLKITHEQDLVLAEYFHSCSK